MEFYEIFIDLKRKSWKSIKHKNKLQKINNFLINGFFYSKIWIFAGSFFQLDYFVQHNRVQDFFNWPLERPLSLQVKIIPTT
jgi:hypothetical protein